MRGQEQKDRLTPEERTTDLFGKDVRTLARGLYNQTVVSRLNDARIVLTGVEPFVKRDTGEGFRVVGPRYQPMEHMQRGDWWAVRLQIGGRTPIRQSLIVVEDSGVMGACVRVTRADRLNPDNTQVPLRREGDVADALGLEANGVYELKFEDDSNILYLNEKRGIQVSGSSS